MKHPGGVIGVGTGFFSEKVVAIALLGVALVVGGAVPRVTTGAVEPR